jgi:hypothetical protein
MVVWVNGSLLKQQAAPYRKRAINLTLFQPVTGCGSPNNSADVWNINEIALV